jgi:hypothetical protein
MGISDRQSVRLQPDVGLRLASKPVSHYDGVPGAHASILGSIPSSRRFAVRSFFAGVVACLIALASAACGQHDMTDDANKNVHSEHISKDQFHGIWPVSPTAGTLGCDLSKMLGAITFSPDDTTDVYAENGAATIWKSQEGWRDFNEIWLPNDGTGGYGPKMDASDFDNEGKKVCQGNGTFEK